MNPADGLAHVLKRGVNLPVSKNINGQHSAIGQLFRLCFAANLHQPVVIIRMLVENTATDTPTNADDAVIQNGASAVAVGVVDEQRDFGWPHAPSDVAVGFKLIDPVESDIRAVGFAQADVQPSAIGPCVFQNLNDFGRSSFVVVSALDDLISRQNSLTLKWGTNGFGASHPHAISQPVSQFNQTHGLIGLHNPGSDFSVRSSCFTNISLGSSCFANHNGLSGR